MAYDDMSTKIELVVYVTENDVLEKKLCNLYTII